MTNFLDNLAPPDPAHATGALYRARGIRDYHLELLPGVPEAMAALPDTYEVMPLDQIEVRYDQGPIPMCVASSGCAAKTIEDFQDVGKWNAYDDDELYKACGGLGHNGIYTDTALAYARDIGCLAADGKRWKIAAYAFAPQIANAWRETLAAALVSSGPCVVATLLPSQFGWNSNEVATGAYHQMCMVSYDGLRDDDHPIFLNSWGKWWGQDGFGRLTWRYLEGNGFQSNFVYGYKLVDVRDFVIPPKPTPPIPDPPQPTPEPPKPNPDDGPIIYGKPKYKHKRVVVVNGLFHPDARLFLDGRQIAVTVKDSQFRFEEPGLSGFHVVRIVQGEDAVEKQFNASKGEL